MPVDNFIVFYIVDNDKAIVVFVNRKLGQKTI